MVLEGQVEDRIAAQISELCGPEGISVTCSRGIPDEGTKGEYGGFTSIVGIAAGFRQHDAFSLSPISVPFNVTVGTRIENDPDGTVHEALVERIAGLLSDWHRHGDAMTSALSTPSFFAGELRMDGGSGRSYDRERSLWLDSIQFTVRGSEIFEKS